MAEQAPKVSSQYAFFRLAVLFLALAQLLVGLDYVTIWPGAEAELIWAAFGEDGTQQLPASLLQLVPQDSPYWLLFYRLPGVLLYLLTLYLFYRWGKPLFGSHTVELALIVTSASLLLPVMPKLASLDSWRFCFSLLFWLAYIRLLKEPGTKWLVISTLMGLLATAVLQEVGLFVVWMIGFGVVYREAWKADWNLSLPFIVVIAAGLLRFFMLPGEADLWSYFTFGWAGFDRYLLLSFLGLAPFIGFTLAGWRDLIYKLRKGEEWSKLIGIGLIGSLLFPSLVFPFLLAVLSARQIHHFFRTPNYPWQNWVKGGMVIHLIAIFFVAAGALLGGAFRFQGDGFRSVLGCAAGYWMFSFVGVIGLYGFRRDYVLGGMSLAGLVGLLFFWVQLYPFLHLQRNWPERMTEKIVKMDERPAEVSLLDSRGTNRTLPLGPYLKRQGVNAGKISEYGSTYQTGLFLDGFALIARGDSLTEFEKDTTTILFREKGWSGLFQEDEWMLIDRRVTD